MQRNRDCPLAVGQAAKTNGAGIGERVQDAGTSAGRKDERLNSSARCCARFFWQKSVICLFLIIFARS